MKKIAVAAVALAAMTGSALAADIYVPPPAAPAPPPAPAFSWEGSYAGAYVSYFIPGGPVGVGMTVGHNFVSGSLVYGIEAQLGGFFAVGFDFSASLTARAGVAVGATDRALLYGEAGVQFIGGGGPGFLVTAGGGIEFAITDSLSIFTEAKAVFGGATGVIATGGLNWHF